MIPIASALKDYPDWRTDRLSITLQNLDVWCSVNLTHNVFVYVRDMKKEIEKGDDNRRINDILTAISSQLKIQECLRAGLRCLFLYPVEMRFDHLVSLVSEKFLIENKAIKEGICPAATDVAYAVIFKDDRFDVRLKVGPMKRDEIEVQFQPDRNTNIPVKSRGLPPEDLFSEFPEVSLLIDIDASLKDPKQNELPQLYANAQEIQSKLSQNIVKYLFGVKEK